MANKIYSIKFAESHLNLVLGLLGKQPYEQVAPIVNSIGHQIQQQQQKAVEDQQRTAEIEAKLTNGHDTDAHA
jgi:hypothetical protein